MRLPWLVVAFLTVACGESGAPSRSAAADAGSDADAGADEDATATQPYVVDAFDRVRINSDSAKPNFQHAETMVDFGAGSFEKVTLVVDLNTTCFPFDSWKDNPPPSGQNWPADCDAFDRNFEFTLDEPATPATDPPAIELVRAITPFGGPLHFEVDLTDVANARPGKHDLHARISTWSDAAGQVSGSDGGWFVSAHVDVVPGTPPRQVLAVVPLFNGTQTEATSPAAIAFDVPAGTTATRLEYRVTGHGGVSPAAGCIGPAEEFCTRSHELFADDQSIASMTPWRADCADLCTLAHQGPSTGGFDYCTENPCGAISSVKAPRANWCPGSVTPPLVYEPAAFATPGPHTFRWTISDVAKGGSWRISALLFAFGEP